MIAIPSALFRCITIWKFILVNFLEQLKQFLSHSLPTSDSSRATVSYLRKYGHLVLVNRLGSLPRNSVDRITDRAQHDLNVQAGL